MVTSPTRVWEGGKQLCVFIATELSPAICHSRQLGDWPLDREPGGRFSDSRSLCMDWEAKQNKTNKKRVSDNGKVRAGSPLEDLSINPDLGCRGGGGGVVSAHHNS